MPKYAENVAVLKTITAHAKETINMDTSEILFDQTTKNYSITVSTKERTSLMILKKLLDN